MRAPGSSLVCVGGGGGFGGAWMGVQLPGRVIGPDGEGGEGRRKTQQDTSHTKF